MIKRRKRVSLQTYAEKFAMHLLFEASSGSVGRAPYIKEGQEKPELPMSFHDRRSLLDSVTKLIAMKHKIDPEEEEDGISGFRERLHDRSDDGSEALGGADSDATEAEGDDSASYSGTGRS